MKRSDDSRLNDYRDEMLKVESEVKKVVIGIDDVVKFAVYAIFSRGHALLDGLPGTAKTMLCHAVARTLGGETIVFEGRPDFTPTQFLYVTEPDDEGNPKFYPGPLISKAEKLVVTLLDEVTRFLSQSQAFWFQIMNEFKYTMPRRDVLFPHNRVFATKNKVTRGETFEIPQPQLDRFLLNLELHYPEREAEEEIIMNEKFDDPAKLVKEATPVITPDKLEEITDFIQPQIQASRTMRRYFLDVVLATRRPSEYGVKLEGVTDIDALVDNRQNASGISPRGAAKWRRVAKVVAFRNNSDHVGPEHALEVAKACLTHRIFVNPKASGERSRSMLARDFLRAVLEKVEAP